MPSWLDELNEPQRAAATHPSGPLLVIAGAGTGKTKTLASRVAWLLKEGGSPERILLLTFTRRAATEMLSRAGHIAGEDAAARVWGGTFHSMAHRLLRQHGRAIGLQPEFTVMDQADSEDLMNLVRSDLGLGDKGKRFPRKSTLQSIYSRCVNSRTRLPEVLKKHFPWCETEAEGIRACFNGYVARKRSRQILDYDDLLLFWNALSRDPQVGAMVAERFDHILVDEYQDTNVVQSEILMGLRKSNNNLMVVGDDAQSIYSFRAATVRNILDFPSHFPGATVVTLEENYRSVQPILDASNAVMAAARERYRKDLFSTRAGGAKPSIISCQDENEQANEVCERVLALREEGLDLKDQAVLFRVGYHSDAVEIELSRRNIPFVKYGGLKFVEAAHVKDLLALLRIVENPWDELAWFRVLLLLDGVGPTGARRILESLGVGPNPSTSEDYEVSTVDQPARGKSPIDRLRDGLPKVSAAATAGFTALCSTLLHCSNSDDAPALTPAVLVERLRRFYEPICEQRYDNSKVRLRDLEQLELIAGRYQSRAQFLADLTLDPPNSTQDLAGPPLLDEDYLILSTIHSAKGCEWDAVHLIHTADGIIPSDMATGDIEEIEEERRLLYVAMTRARDTLNLFFPLRYYERRRGFTDRHSYAQLTRFIPSTDLCHYQQERARAASPIGSDGHSTTPAGGREAVDKMISDLWD